MQPAEPFQTALLLTIFGFLLAASAVFSRASERIGVPLMLVFLAIGMLAGSEGIGRIAFEDYHLAYRLGTIALVLILFDGGLNTPIEAMRRTLVPAGLLATVGVAAIAGLVAIPAYLLGLPLPAALVLGAVVSSTDAAAVFSVLRGSGLHLKRRVGATLEVESGINDPMAVILVTELTANLVNPGRGIGWGLLLDVVLQLVIGGAIGYAIGRGARSLVSMIRLPAGGLYPVLTLACACLAFGAATLANGSGFLAVFIAGFVLAQGYLPYRTSLLRVHDSLAWLSQIAMFLVLGLLVFPSRLLPVAPLGLGLALILTVVVRPLVVAVILVPLRYRWREILYIGWVGLRGAVPIVLAMVPVLAGAPDATRIFDLVFFIVVASAIVPGGTVAWATRRLGLETHEPPPPRALLEIESRQPLAGALSSYYVDEALAVCGASLAELPFPDGASVALLVRGNELIAPKGHTVIQPGDHVYVFYRPEHHAVVQLMFGTAEDAD